MRTTGNLLLAGVISLASVPYQLAADDGPADASAPANLSPAAARVLVLEARIRQLEDRLARMEAVQNSVPAVQYVQYTQPLPRNAKLPMVIPAQPSAELGEEINGIKFRVFLLGGGEQGKQPTPQPVIEIAR